MPYYDFVWSDDLVAHIAEHDLTPEDFEEVICNPTRVGTSRSSGSPAALGLHRRWSVCFYGVQVFG